MHGASRTQFHQRHGFNRRSLLKSAAGAFIGASALHLGSQTAFAQKSSTQSEDGNSGQLRKHMLGFMLSHEQFPVTQLIQLGTAAEAAGLICSPPAITFSLGSLMKDMPEKPGSPWERLAPALGASGLGLP